MVNFQHIVLLEVEFTPGTLPLLSLEQDCYSFGKFGMVSHACGPIDPIAIIGAFLPFDLRMPDNGSMTMFVQLMPFSRGKNPLARFQPPIFFGDPCARPIRVATIRPMTQFQVGEVRQFLEGVG